MSDPHESPQTANQPAPDPSAEGEPPLLPEEEDVVESDSEGGHHADS